MYNFIFHVTIYNLKSSFINNAVYRSMIHKSYIHCIKLLSCKFDDNHTCTLRFIIVTEEISTQHITVTYNSFTLISIGFTCMYIIIRYTPTSITCTHTYITTYMTLASHHMYTYLDGWIHYYHRQYNTMMSQNSVLILA